MRKFKLRTGVSNPYEINVENFEKLTLKQEPYHKEFPVILGFVRPVITRYSLLDYIKN